MEEKIAQLKAEAAAAVQGAADVAALNDIRVKYLGKKGEFTSILRGMGSLSAEERPKVGKIVNVAKAEIETLIGQQDEMLKTKDLEARLASEKIDVTLPGRSVPMGHLHPLTLTLERIKDIFVHMGFSVEEGPEIERDYFNFEALNLPKDHPARDMQDSFYITDEILLRSQTSPVQARTMQSNEPNKPIRMIAPGRVYRRDEYDATHSPMFTQVEGLVIDEGISLADLKGRSSCSCIRFSTRMSASDSVQASSRSRSRRLRSIFPVLCVMARAARSVRARAGWRSLALAWFIRMFLK